VDDALGRVAALEAEEQVALGVAVEAHAPFQKLADAIRGA
jgi:hypothetical protein